MNNPIYSVENLSFIKNKNLLLKIKKFEIHRGACYMFSGEMCSGKTLLMNFLTKNSKAYNGDIIYDTQSAVILEELIGKFLLNMSSEK